MRVRVPPALPIVDVSTLGFQRTYYVDLVKCIPCSDYCIADWGAESRWWVT